jgi:anti-sigma regulatory factor (Ser/Thr protein kinase)
LDSGNEDDTVVMEIRVSPTTPAPVFSETFRAVPEELRRIRVAVRAWLRGNAVSAEQETDLVLAIGEACANAAEHAYAGSEPGTIEIRIAHAERDDELHVRVRDFGTWREAPPGSSGADRGRGTDLMKALVDDFERETGSAGTTVSFGLRHRVNPERAATC